MNNNNGSLTTTGCKGTAKTGNKKRGKEKSCSPTPFFDLRQFYSFSP